MFRRAISAGRRSGVVGNGVGTARRATRRGPGAARPPLLSPRGRLCGRRPTLRSASSARRRRLPSHAGPTSHAHAAPPRRRHRNHAHCSAHPSVLPAGRAGPGGRPGAACGPERGRGRPSRGHAHAGPRGGTHQELHARGAAGGQGGRAHGGQGGAFARRRRPVSPVRRSPARPAPPHIPAGAAAGRGHGGAAQVGEREDRGADGRDPEAGPRLGRAGQEVQGGGQAGAGRFNRRPGQAHCCPGPGQRHGVREGTAGGTHPRHPATAAVATSSRPPPFSAPPRPRRTKQTALGKKRDSLDVELVKAREEKSRDDASRAAEKMAFEEQLKSWREQHEALRGVYSDLRQRCVVPFRFPRPPRQRPAPPHPAPRRPRSPTPGTTTRRCRTSSASAR